MEPNGSLYYLRRNHWNRIQTKHCYQNKTRTDSHWLSLSVSQLIIRPIALYGDTCYEQNCVTMIYVDETEPDEGMCNNVSLCRLFRSLSHSLCYLTAEIEPPFEPRNVSVKNKSPEKDYSLGEELGRYCQLILFRLLIHELFQCRLVNQAHFSNWVLLNFIIL